MGVGLLQQVCSEAARRAQSDCSDAQKRPPSDSGQGGLVFCRCVRFTTGAARTGRPRPGCAGSASLSIARPEVERVHAVLLLREHERQPVGDDRAPREIEAGLSPS
mgnify:CR=1 FL=1